MWQNSEESRRDQAAFKAAMVSLMALRQRDTGQRFYQADFRKLRRRARKQRRSAGVS